MLITLNDPAASPLRHLELIVSNWVNAWCRRFLLRVPLSPPSGDFMVVRSASRPLLPSLCTFSPQIIRDMRRTGVIRRTTGSHLLGLIRQLPRRMLGCMLTRMNPRALLAVPGCIVELCRTPQRAFG